MNILKCIYIYIYNWIPILYSSNQYSFINQLYFNKNKLKLYAVMEMKFESIILSEKAQHKWLRILWFLLYKIIRIVSSLNQNANYLLTGARKPGQWVTDFLLR